MYPPFYLRRSASLAATTLAAAALFDGPDGDAHPLRVHLLCFAAVVTDALISQYFCPAVDRGPFEPTLHLPLPLRLLLLPLRLEFRLVLKHQLECRKSQ